MNILEFRFCFLFVFLLLYKSENTVNRQKFNIFIKRTFCIKPCKQWRQSTQYIVLYVSEIYEIDEVLIK